MTWLIVCAAIGALLGLGTWWVMGELMQGVGTEVTFWRGLREGWILLLVCFVVWTAVCAGIYWIAVGLTAMWP